MGSVRGTRYSTEDPEQALEASGQVYTRLRMHTCGMDRFRMNLSTVTLDPLSVETAAMSCPRTCGELDGTGIVRVGHLRAGSFTLVTGGAALPAVPVFLFPAQPYTGWWEDLGLTTVTVPLGVVQDHARALLDAPGFRLRFTGHRPMSAPGYWRATVEHLISDVLPNEAVTTSVLVRAQAVNTVVTALLHTFPGTFSIRRQAPEPTRAVTAPVRRAVAFIETHLAEPIGLPEIAAAARMSPRGLQAAFARTLDTTPTAYLRTARLAAARTDLLHADPGAGNTVAGIAARWGFAHPGRFATTYRQTYGESPATTLNS